MLRKVKYNIIIIKKWHTTRDMDGTAHILLYT